MEKNRRFFMFRITPHHPPPNPRPEKGTLNLPGFQTRKMPKLPELKLKSRNNRVLLPIRVIGLGEIEGAVQPPAFLSTRRTVDDESGDLYQVS